MTEMEIMNQFNTFLISNAIYLAAGFFILWVAFRMVVNIQADPSAPMLNKVLATLFGLGSLSSFSLPPYNFFFINFFTFPFLFYILVINLDRNLLNNFLVGWFFGLGYFLTNLYWISNSLKFDQNFENLIFLSIILIPFLLSFFYGLFSYLLKFFNIKMNFISILIFSLTLSIVEYLRGTIFGGFPWNLISFSLVKFIVAVAVAVC